jgi:hypothetical protein
MLTTADDAEDLVEAIEPTAARLCAAIRAEAAATTACAGLLADLTARLLEERNPVSGRPHSQSSAEKAARQTTAYELAQRDRLNAECQRVNAAATLERVTLLARLAVAKVTATAVHAESPTPRCRAPRAGR